MTYPAFRDECLRFAAALQSIGVSKGDRVALFSHSCAAWQIVHFGCHYCGAVLVPINDVMKNDMIKYMLRHSECKLFVVHGHEAENVREIVPDGSGIPIVLIAALTTGSVMSFEGFLNRGRAFSQFVKYEAARDDIAVIIYRSGSDETPKGCVLTHENLIAGATGLSSVGTHLGADDCYFSFLPLAHIYELCCHLMMIGQGVRTGFFTNDLTVILKDVDALQPTILCGVPRFFNRLVDQIHRTIDKMSPLFKWVMNWGIRLKRENFFNAALPRRHDRHT
jgi:long-chain acyl-CoA synthetase